MQGFGSRAGDSGRRAGQAAAGLGLVFALALGGCGRGASDAARRHPDDAGDRGGSPTRGYGDAGSDRGGASGSDRSYARRDDDGGYRSRSSDGQGGRSERGPVPQFHGEPLWSDNSRHTAEENAHYHCDKSGADIGAKGYDDCLTKVHALLDHPPAGAETATRPSNGDKLVYDPKANVFAVARKDGAPRTFFKPREGADYWREQKDHLSDAGGYRSHRDSARRDDSGSREGGSGD